MKPEHKKKVFHVESETPLLDFLKERFPGIKNKPLRQRLAHHGVLVDGKVEVNAKCILKPGQTVELTRGAIRPLPLPKGMVILHEDEDLIVIRKPENLLTMASETEKRKTAYFNLTNHVRYMSGRGDARIFIVHRLDLAASGLLVFAKNEKTKFALQEHWSDADKIYVAVVEGHPPEEKGRIQSILKESPTHRMFSIKRAEPDDGDEGDDQDVDEEGQEAITDYRVIKGTPKKTMLEVRLITGRKNQIRVHCAENGFPIVGDHKYGLTKHKSGRGKRGRSRIGRLALHAWKLSFTHPGTGKRMSFEDKIPRDFFRALNQV
ncbi:MAG: RluA family pseudouridine synthase [Spirochaetia bacterium]|nr:RluA family pseudouridine synthase [Spirochaetia bacterium]